MFGHRQHHDYEDDSVARGLGWVSIMLGVGGIAAARPIAKLIGVENATAEGIIRVVGVRELCHGIDILSHRDPTPGVWSRVAGDVLDGVLLGIAAKKTTNPAGFATAAALVAPVVLADMIEAPKLSAQKAMA
jgi:hypothetical protein